MAYLGGTVNLRWLPSKKFASVTTLIYALVSVADPGFPRREAPTLEFGPKAYYLARFFAKNCTKMKEIGPGGARDTVNGNETNYME